MCGCFDLVVFLVGVCFRGGVIVLSFFHSQTLLGCFRSCRILFRSKFYHRCILKHTFFHLTTFVSLDHSFYHPCILLHISHKKLEKEREEGRRKWWMSVSLGFPISGLEEPIYNTNRFDLQWSGDFTWRVSDCEELVRVSLGRSLLFIFYLSFCSFFVLLF